MISFSRPLLIAVGAVLASGCATMGRGEFSCPAPDGVSCMSTTDIYEATNARTNLEAGMGKTAVVGVTTEWASLSLAPSTRSQVVAGAGALSFASEPVAKSNEMPLRSEARVMRIWVAPWTDESGDLVMPGNIFTEIEGRRWTIGGQVPSAASSLFDPNRIVSDGSTSFNPNL
ncbi:MAG: hypothetical protein DDT34_01467 [Firmicutes bacterium]|nr:hypothetical protein [Bacillota bacterium]